MESFNPKPVRTEVAAATPEGSSKEEIQAALIEKLTSMPEADFQALVTELLTDNERKHLATEEDNPLIRKIARYSVERGNNTDIHGAITSGIIGRLGAKERILTEPKSYVQKGYGPVIGSGADDIEALRRAREE